MRSMMDIKLEGSSMGIESKRLGVGILVVDQPRRSADYKYVEQHIHGLIILVFEYDSKSEVLGFTTIKHR